MLGFLNIQFSLELLEKVYLKVVKARQMIRHECPNTTLKTRTYWTGQRDAESGEILVENLEETSEVFVRIEDFRPDDEPLHGMSRRVGRLYFYVRYAIIKTTV